MKRTLLLFLTALLPVVASAEALYYPKNDPYFSKFHPAKAPETHKLLLKEGDRLAICGDSITEQKMYSRIIETYLTVCTPELHVTARQFGWSGEQAPGFLNRMTNDVLRFHPTIATTCYGMNDHLYRRYKDEIGERYLSNSIAIVESFKHAGTRVIQGSPGAIGVRPGWSQDKDATADDMNYGLCELRNMGVAIARAEDVAFADVFWPMLIAGHDAHERYGKSYEVSGKDGVHPGWSGHLIMAYAFLKSMGLDGDLGTITVKLGSDKAKATEGHEIVSAKKGEVTVKSMKYPFCAVGPTDKDTSIRSAMTLVPFNEELNRLTLVVKDAKKNRDYSVTWGEETKNFSGKKLAEGINLAAEFPKNPFSDAFNQVDEAVAAKQAYETKQIKQSFRSPEAKKDMEAVAAATEKERAPLAAAIPAAFHPVTHTIRISER